MPNAIIANQKACETAATETLKDKNPNVDLY